ncbi:MAG: 50S ribosomal protein L19 [Candidatus Moranbacteria bacterium CG23_combo_of_CG06-09_8_20_14_all_39_10]|nr:MAG: 50S ribosomal protein L19 [Candidatus Moranbacteria bacterium CG23_combo_of_CG06-09_8_20_14_all_39_10]
MEKKVIEFNNAQRNKPMPEFNAGDVVKVYKKIKEGDKERIQLFEGLVIAVKGGQSSSPTITVRKVSGGIGVELIVPIFSPTIEKIEKVKTAKVRRARLYYLRGLTAKKSRMKYTDAEAIVPEEKLVEAPVVNEVVEIPTVPEEKSAEAVVEEVKAEEAK